jgi:prepilin-type N-terminal cleavage/methylation domain-containing protein
MTGWDIIMRRDNSVAQRQRWFFTLLALRRKSGAGFTLIELLVALLISGLMVSVLLYMVVQLMGTNQREAARSDVQRDAQAAIDYITRDLREAVYVYDGNCLQNGTGSALNNATNPATIVCPGLLRYLPAAINAANKQPVLAFWRLEDLPTTMRAYCDASAAAIAPAAGGAALPTTDPRTFPPCSTKKMYTLVVYSVETDNPTGSWRGRARLSRYKLPQYSDGANTGAAQTPGWVSPIQTGLTFVSWPKDSKDVDYQALPILPPTATDPRGGGGRAAGVASVVLMDFLDDVATTAAAGDANDAALCPNLPNLPQNTAGGFNVSVQSGQTAASKFTRSFYACVRGATPSAANPELANQEVVIRLKANAAGKAGLPLLTANIPITMESRVMLRGALGKTN